MLARQTQARLWNRISLNFPQTQGPVARREFRVSLRFCAPEGFCLAKGVTPVIGVRGKATMSMKCSSGAVPGDPLVTFPSLGKEPAPQGGTLPPPAGGEIPPARNKTAQYKNTCARKMRAALVK